MKRQQKSDYNFSEAMKNGDSATNFEMLNPDTFLKSEPLRANNQSNAQALESKKFKNATPFLDNFDAEFQEPDFKGTNPAQGDSFGQFQAKPGALENPFDAFGGSKPSQNLPESTDMLQQVLTQGFLSTKESTNTTYRTPFD